MSKFSMGRRPCEDTGRDWMLLPPRTSWGYQKPKETRVLPERVQREQGPANTLILAFYPLERWDNIFLLFKTTQFVVLYYGSPTIPGNTNIGLSPFSILVTFPTLRWIQLFLLSYLRLHQIVSLWTNVF